MTTYDPTIRLDILREKALESAQVGDRREYYRRASLVWELERTPQIGLDGLEDW